MQWNSRSVFKKLLQLKSYISELSNQPDVICIQQIHLSNKYQPAIHNYAIIRKDRPPHLGKGGRLAICVRQSVVYSDVDISSSDIRLETTGVKIGGISIFNVYSPPSNSFNIGGFVFQKRCTLRGF